MPPNVHDAVVPYAEPIQNDIREADKDQAANLDFPNLKVPAKLENENEQKTEDWFKFKTQLIWPNIIGITLLHIGTIYTFSVYSFADNKMLTLWGLITGCVGGFGVTGGVHRLWTHNAYKASMPLRSILAFCYLMAGENSIYNWVRDHRVHHKFSETDADPHDSRRGFFFSHVGWLMMKKHPEVIRRGNQIDMSDLMADPVVQFTERHFSKLKLLTCFVLPIAIPIYCWNEDWYMTVISQLFIRYPFTLNATWSVNSFAHLWGYHSYDKTINPAENKWVAFASMGEGWHNYHHAFPWDYKAAEFGNYGLNMTTMFIDGFAKIGWATDLKVASENVVRRTVEKKGDGSHPHWGKSDE